MKLTSYSFNSDVPPEKVCRPGIDYRVHEADVTPEGALTFFGKLIRPRDSFCLETPEWLLDFWKHEGAIRVEVTGAEFWATSEISAEEARAVIETLGRGGKFAGRIPTTGREWDAYSLLGEGKGQRC